MLFTLNNLKKKIVLTLRNIFSANEAGLSTSVNAGGPVPMILQRA